MLSTFPLSPEFPEKAARASCFSSLRFIKNTPTCSHSTFLIPQALSFLAAAASVSSRARATVITQAQARRRALLHQYVQPDTTMQPTELILIARVSLPGARCRGQGPRASWPALQEEALRARLVAARARAVLSFAALTGLSARLALAIPLLTHTLPAPPRHDSTLARRPPRCRRCAPWPSAWPPRSPTRVRMRCRAPASSPPPSHCRHVSHCLQALAPALPPPAAPPFPPFPAVAYMRAFVIAPRPFLCAHMRRRFCGPGAPTRAQVNRC